MRTITVEKGPGREKLERKKLLEVVEACMAVFWYTPGFRWITTAIELSCKEFLSEQEAIFSLPPSYSAYKS